jgi:hypothetical protein
MTCRQNEGDLPVTQTPYDPNVPAWLPGQTGYYAAGQLKTSGMAIASLVCGILGLVTCCAIAPSALAVIFGGVSLSTIRRGEASGRGLAITGIVLGVIGLLVGVLFWIFAATSPDIAPIPGREVSAGDRQVLEDIGVLEPDEKIELFYSGGMLSIRETGAVITTGRLVLYQGDADIEAAALADINAVTLTPGIRWIEDGQFVVETDQGDVMVFSVAAEEDGDRLFHRVLARLVSEAREQAGKPAPTAEISARKDDN